jgi:hypothetical protein
MECDSKFCQGGNEREYGKPVSYNKPAENKDVNNKEEDKNV